MKLSLVLPAYNEQERIAESVRAVDCALARMGCTYEIIVGSDGCTDRTVEAVRRLGLPSTRIIERPHGGKGAILRDCLMTSRGEYAGFLDADLEIDVSYVPEFVKALDDGFDAAVASKTLNYAYASERRLSRRISTRGYNLLVRLFFGSPLTDHQAGLKLFRGDYLRSILPSIDSAGWLWDTEVLLRLLRDGKRIKEIPVKTRSFRESRVGMIVTSFDMLGGLLGLYLRERRGD